MKSLLLITALLLPQHLMAADKVLPVLNSPIADITQNANAPAQNINLDSVFGTESIDSQVVRFTSQASNGSRVMDFALFSTRTPITRTNFLNYVTAGDYNDSFIHRSVSNFVIQGGGFFRSSPTDVFPFSSVPTDPAITNEFDVSNTYGTISMAKNGGNPNSATSQWFVSLGANSDILDPQNGGFTVFGRITKSTLNSAKDFNNDSLFPLADKSADHSAFGELPLIASYSNGTVTSNDLILFPSVALAPLNPADAGENTTLTYSIISNSTPSVVNPSITGGNQLQLSYQEHASGSSTLTIRATDSVGNTVDDTFIITVHQTYTSWRHTHFPLEDAADDNVSGPQADHNHDGVSNLELYIHGLTTTAHHTTPVTFYSITNASTRYPAFILPVSNLNGVTVEFQKSTNLNTGSWSSEPFGILSQSTQGNITTYHIRTIDPVATVPAFFRLHYTLAE